MDLVVPLLRTSPPQAVRVTIEPFTRAALHARCGAPRAREVSKAAERFPQLYKYCSTARVGASTRVKSLTDH